MLEQFKCNPDCCKKAPIWIANMGHGEAILFRHGEDNGKPTYYLRDFGQSSSDRDCACNVDRILGQDQYCEKTCPQKGECMFRYFMDTDNHGINRCAILSHYHEDHLSGFVQMINDTKYKGFFDIAYLPHQCAKKDFDKYKNKIFKNILMYCFSKDGYYYPHFSFSSLYGYSSHYDIRRNALSFLTHEVLMANLSKQIVHCSRINSSSNFPGTILIPIISNTIDSEVLYNNEKKIDDLISYIKNNKSMNDFLASVNEITKILEKYVTPDTYTDTNNSSIKDYNNIINMMEKLSFPQQEDILHLIPKNVFREDMTKKYDDGGLSFSIDISLTRCKKNKLYVKKCKLCTSTTPCRECHCKNEVECIESCPLCNYGAAISSEAKDFQKWLFLGDHHSATLKVLYPDIFAQYFDCIKASHHGTRGGDLLKKMRVKCRLVVCCCGPRQRCGTPQDDYAEISECMILTDENDSWITKPYCPKPTLKSKIKKLNAEIW